MKALEAVWHYWLFQKRQIFNARLPSGKLELNPIFICLSVDSFIIIRGSRERSDQLLIFFYVCSLFTQKLEDEFTTIIDINSQNFIFSARSIPKHFLLKQQDLRTTNTNNISKDHLSSNTMKSRAFKYSNKLNVCKLKEHCRQWQ